MCKHCGYARDRYDARVLISSRKENAVSSINERDDGIVIGRVSAFGQERGHRTCVSKSCDIRVVSVFLKVVFGKWKRGSKCVFACDCALNFEHVEYAERLI